MITFNNFTVTCKTQNAAAALYRLLAVQFENWKAEMVSLQLVHIERLQADVLAEREAMNSNTVYCGWGTYVDEAIEELERLQDCRLELNGCTIKTVQPE